MLDIPPTLIIFVIIFSTQMSLYNKLENLYYWFLFKLTDLDMYWSMWKDRVEEKNKDEVVRRFSNLSTVTLIIPFAMFYLCFIYVSLLALLQ